MNMRSSIEEAMSFFNRWRKDRTRLDFIFSGKSVNFKFSGFLFEASLEKGLVAANDGAFGVGLTASLHDAVVFDFADPREASEEQHAIVEANIESVWEITLRGGDKLTLYELRG
jgi:hypothetical protein